MKLPEWQEIASDYIERNIPAELSFRQSPRMMLSVDSSKEFLAARFETTQFFAVSRSLSEVSIENVVRDEVKYVELAVHQRRLFQAFYFFALTVFSKVSSAEAAHVYDGVEDSVESWDALLTGLPESSIEKQIGLYAELTVLHALIESLGDDALTAWTGPLGDPHDFRLGLRELEVKATLRDRRRHIVNGPNQLSPSGENELVLISVMVARAGLGGESLEELTSSIEARLTDRANRAKFRSMLSAIGYHAESEAARQNRWQLAGPIMSLPVRSGTPRLTAAALASVPAEYASERVALLSYEIDITGLGVETSLADFATVIQRGG